MDHGKFMQETDERLMRDYMSAMYFKVMLPYTSLFFFRSRHLFHTLELMSKDETYRREKHFWQKSEDLILRVKSQLTLEELTRVVSIYKRVSVS